MTRWYQNYLALLTRLATNRFLAVRWLVVLLLGCGCWTGYWLFVEQRRGGALLLPLLTSLWLLNWIFIRLIFAIERPLLAKGATLKVRLKFYWFYLKFHGTAFLILSLLLASVFISLKLGAVVWRSFG